MAAPTVASTTPADGATDFSYRSSLSAVFSTALLSSSVNRSTLSLYESVSGHDVDIDVSLSADALTVTVIPRSPLRQNVNYVFSLIGNDIGSPGGPIKSADGDALAVTYSVTFRTDEDRYVSLEEITSRDDIERVGPIRDVEDEASEVGYLEVTDVTPDSMAGNESRTLDTIEVDFGESVATTGSGSAITLVMTPADGMTRDYGHQDVTGKFLYRDVETYPSRQALITDPVGSVVASGTKLIWTRDSSYEFPYNAQIAVRVHSDRVTNASGYQLEEDLYFTFTTEYWPVYASPTVIRIELGPSISQLHDDTLWRIILKNSIGAILESGDKCGFSRDRPYPNTEKYVKAKSVIDVIDLLRFLSDLQAGQRKQLGDFTVQYTATDPSLIAKRNQALEDMKRALRELRRYRGAAGPRSAIKSASYETERGDWRMRTWDSMIASSSPVANTYQDREARRQLRSDHGDVSSSYLRVVADENQEIVVSGPDFVRVLSLNT